MKKMRCDKTLAPAHFAGASVFLFCGSGPAIRVYNFNTNRAMMIPFRSLMLILLSYLLLVSASPTSIGADNPKTIEPKQREFFEARIRPVLIKHCYECHSAKSDEVKGNLLVDSAAGLLQGGDSGPAIVAGKPDESPLIEALRYDGVEMPPAGRLSPSIVKNFEHWVEMGAPDPRTDQPAPGVIKPQRTIDLEAGRQFWAFRPVEHHQQPEVSDKSWPKSYIDAFVLRKLETAGLKPAVDADRRTLIRRLYFDLIGLPPSPKEVMTFVADKSNNAVDGVVDQVLDSPEFTGDGTGSMSLGMPTQMARTSTRLSTTPGNIAITSSTRSTATSRLMSLCGSRLRETCLLTKTTNNWPKESSRPAS